MARLKCTCGNILSNTASPNTVEGLIIRDLDLEFKGTIGPLELMDMGRDVWECDECGRLAVSYPGKNDARVKWYSPDNNEIGNLMK